MKSNVEEELKNSIEKSKLLGYELISKIEYNLPIENSKRTILKYKNNYKHCVYSYFFLFVCIYVNIILWEKRTKQFNYMSE